MNNEKPAPVGKTTQTRIIEAARFEFLRLGFNDSSLRSIVKAAGVTTGAFYGYYRDKEALFAAVVEPAADKLREVYLSAQMQFAELPIKAKAEVAFAYSKEELIKFIDCVYSDFDAFKLVICRSAGTGYENYIHSLVDIEVEYTLSFFKDLTDAGLTDFDLKPDLMHILFSSYFHAIFETVVHDMSRDDAGEYIESLCDFFSAGWKRLWGI